MSHSNLETGWVVPEIRKFMLSRDKIVNTVVLAQTMERFSHMLSNQFGPEREPRTESNLKLYPSEAGKCERGILYKALGIPGEPFLPDVKFKFALGDVIELLLIHIIGHCPDIEVRDNNLIREIRIGRRSWRGATDGIVKCSDGLRRNLEVKSTSAVSYKITKKKGIDNAFGYLSQACVYTRHLKEEGVIDVPETVFVYVDRDSNHMFEETVCFKDWEFAEEADAKFDRILDAIETRDERGKRKMLPRPFDLEKGKLGLQCRYCDHKHSCWTKPSQVVTYDVESGEPVYDTEPRQYLQMVMNRNKPSWILVGENPQ